MTYSALLLIVGRVLLGSLFVVAGIHHFFVLPALTSVLASRGIPPARSVLIAASVLELVAGLLLMAGIQVAIAALALVLFTRAASVLLLNFWDMEGAARDSARSTWQSNLAIIGGLLILAAQAL